MDQHSAPTAPPAPPAPPATPRPPARRSSTDRMVGGVGTATAQYLGVSRDVARILLLVASAVGGLGLVLYAALWLFVPDDHERVLIQGAARSSGESTAAALMSGLAALVLSAWVTQGGPSWLASILVTIGVFVLSRRSPTGDADPTGSLDATTHTDPTAPTDPAEPAWPGPGPDEPGADAAAATTGVLPLVGERPPVFPRAVPGPRAAPPVTPRPPKAPRPAPFLGPLTVSVAIVAAGVLGLLRALDVVELRPSDILITVLVIVALGLLVSTWFGRARGLVLLGLLLVPIVAVSAVLDRVDLRGGTGERLWAPTTAAELRDEYRLGAGSLVVDLTRMDESTIDEGDPTLRTVVSMGAGEVRLVVPEDWSLELDTRIGIGTVWLYSGGAPVPDDGSVDELDPGWVEWDLAGSGDWSFTQSDEVPSDAGDGVGDRRSISVAGVEGAPTLDAELIVTAGEVEVFRVAP